MKKTIIAKENDGCKDFMLAMTFDVPDEDFDLLGAIKKAVAAICNTPKGRARYEKNHQRFDWGDFIDFAYGTNTFCERFGFKLDSTAPADITVDLGDSLADETKFIDLTEN